MPPPVLPAEEPSSRRPTGTAPRRRRDLTGFLVALAPDAAAGAPALAALGIPRRA
jgi:hypothetical protein